MKFKSKMSEAVYKAKYMLDTDKTMEDPLRRIDDVVSKYYPHLKGKCIEYGTKKWVGFAGGLYRSANNPNKNVSAVNCTTLYSPEDNLESISNAWYWWAKFAATGQGEGIDMSNLRPNGAVVHNSSNSSTGPVSFMKTFDGILKEIAQQGRRGASLISLSISHPDALEFMRVKDEEGILETANISFKVSDKFMEAVENDEDWEFKYENEYETISKTISARELFRLIAEHAHKSGDPGLLFWDTSKRFSNSDVLGYPIENVNACSEQVLDGHNVCLLSSINLAKYREYGYETYKELIKFMVFVLDAFRREELEEGRSPSEEQLRKLVEMPRIGLGVTGFADSLIHQGIPYGGEDSEKWAEMIFSTLTAESYKASYDIAKNYDMKSFPAYDKEKYKTSNFVKMLLDEGLIEDYHLDYQAHVCKTTLAPNGSLTMIVEAGGSGVEPLYSKYFVRRERSTGNDWTDWFTFNDLVTQHLEENGLEVTKENADKLDKSLWRTAHNVDNKEKLSLIKVVQKYIDSAVSITYNLPETCDVTEIEEIYMTAWRNGAKGVTVYREGSKGGVLITEDNYNKEERYKTKTPKNEDRITSERPKDLPCVIKTTKVKGEQFTILIGLLNGKPYEVFATKHLPELDKKKEGVIRKRKKNCYDLYSPEDHLVIEDLSNTFDHAYGVLSRLVSMSLRHDVPLQFIVGQLLKGKDFVSFEKAVAKALKPFIGQGEKDLTSEKCPDCGSGLTYIEGCKSCPKCFWSKCG